MNQFNYINVILTVNICMFTYLVTSKSKINNNNNKLNKRELFGEQSK